MTGARSGAGDETDFDPIEFLAEAVRIPSHENVDRLREFLIETIEADGVAARVDDAGNVRASRGAVDGAGTTDGTGAADGTGGTHLVLNTHIDTVTPHVPFERDESAGVIRGRGSCDAKGPLAALLAAFLAVDPSEGRVTLAITPDEEALSTGAHALVSDPESPVRDADGVIVGEPTDLDVCTAAKGRFEGTIALSGANAHAAEPESGANAIGALESVLRAIERFDDREDAPPTHPELGEATLTPTVVEGGAATNQVPAECRLTVDRRSVPPETAAEFRTALLDHLRAAAPDDVGVDFSFTGRSTPFLEAWETDADEPIAAALADAGGGRTRPFTAATEASYFAARAPTVVFGPGVLADAEGAVAHAPREYVRVEDVADAATAIETVLREFVA